MTGEEEFERYYLPQVNEVRGGDAVVGFSQKLWQAYGTVPFRAFLMGHPGVGRSTEIIRLLARVEDQYVRVPENAYKPLPPGAAYAPLVPASAGLPELTARSVGWGLFRPGTFSQCPH